jgi:hypothetical protein
MSRFEGIKAISIDFAQARKTVGLFLKSTKDSVSYEKNRND